MAADAIVVGGGVIGLAIARELARARLRVVLACRDAPGMGTSSAAAGMLERHFPGDMPAPLRALAEAGNALYPAFVQALREETGLDPGLDRSGTLALAADGGEFDTLRAEARGVAGARLLTVEADWLALEPGLPRGLAGALALDDVHAVNAPRLAAALVLAVERLGVDIRRGVSVRGIASAGGRATGVETDAGPLRAAWTVNAAGAWAGGLAGAARLPVRPVKGQAVLLDGGPLPARVLYDRRVYLVPRRDEGRLVVGATVEEEGFGLAPTAGAVRRLLADGAELFPPLATARFAGVRVGLRPATPDGLPVLGPAELPGLLHAAGHYRKGILLAPVTARIIAALVRGEPPAVPLAPFSPARFPDAVVAER